MSNYDTHHTPLFKPVLRDTTLFRPSCCRKHPDLDGLTLADYNIDDSNEVFTIDDPGNGDMVNVRDGNSVDYVIDANTNVLAGCKPLFRQTAKASAKNAPHTSNFL